MVALLALCYRFLVKRGRNRMDDHHQAELLRILTNRKLRGASANSLHRDHSSTSQFDATARPSAAAPQQQWQQPESDQQQDYNRNPQSSSSPMQRVYSNIPMVESQSYDVNKRSMTEGSGGGGGLQRSTSRTMEQEPYIVPATTQQRQQSAALEDESLGNRPPRYSATTATAAKDERFLDRIGSMLNVDPKRAGSESATAAPAAGPSRSSSVSAGLMATPGSRVLTRGEGETSEDRGAGLFRKGVFDNFKHAPFLVTPNVKPYLKPSISASRRSLGAATVDRSRSASPGFGSVGGGSPRARNEKPRGGTLNLGEVAVTAQITQPNPFRSQTFEGFCVAPNEAAPREVEAILAAKNADNRPKAHNNKDEVLAPPFRTINRTGLPEHADAPIHEMRDILRTLRHGDWFLKWTRAKDKIHQRYFWLDETGTTLFWAKAPHAAVIFTSNIKVSEISDLQTKTVSDPLSGRTMHILIIWSVSRVAQIGTELREKFDLWFDALRRLTMRHREHNAAFYSRHATMQPVRPTTVYGRIPVQHASE